MGKVEQQIIYYLNLQSVPALRIVSQLLLLFNGKRGSLVRGQTSAKSTSELLSQIVRLVGGLLELFSKLLFLGLVVDSQHSGNGLSNITT